MSIKTFQAANFTGCVGSSFRFQTLDDSGNALGPVLAGTVTRIFRQGWHISVEIHLPRKYCTHIYEAKRLYFKGPYRPRN